MPPARALRLGLDSESGEEAGLEARAHTRAEAKPEAKVPAGEEAGPGARVMATPPGLGPRPGPGWRDPRRCYRFPQ